ncbi:hypothetical protein Caci_4096 [Catenulispora acidiphila DSM 44928]|uniref:Resolvase/invertase-type recombinase catalytic domain-containing protein n=1 Tax=Catenulispora acidiphila (strain DSM 44928 / JCM 14897 / NBRC 102108 / NRRL B-24433 / ID139908) TaxID=479433 RepID=C7QGB5_CATAD|nr:recombinase family protein [Catenulispora acidiphila]ACU72960.1 hypothetical protein Caci_4096 [Catenulispora acidiphila DSM 44928]
MSRSDSDGARIRAVFYHRVGSGTPGDQDAAVLRQAARIAELAQRLKLQVVGVYTDFAVTRSTPWPARPAARKLTQRLADKTVRAEVVIVEDPHHAIGPANIPAALKAIGIPACTPREALHPVTADDLVIAIAARMSTPPSPTRRARRFPISDRRR